MNTLSIKLPPELERDLDEASRRERTTRSEIVRRALAAYVNQPPRARRAFVSALEQAGDLVGCFEGGPGDLSTNPLHLEEFGRP